MGYKIILKKKKHNTRISQLLQEKILSSFYLRNCQVKDSDKVKSVIEYTLTFITFLYFNIGT